uniref:protein CRABS CLAW n=1 Tax=Erigeron canadensis TaxID=72917 RepID=UPI001CB9B47B|nr:protein CRABS CLAW [Erigeron canadensis]
MIMNFEVQAERVVNMDPPVQIPPDQHLCYVRCNFCSTLLAVVIPCRRLLDTVTVKCGHCSNVSFLTIRTTSPPAADHPPPVQPPLLPPFQAGFSNNDVMKSRGQSSSSSSSVTSNEPTSPKAPFVVKPPEKKHRLPSAYNRFMKEEIQRIKASNPQIPHREAFSTAAKNWAGHVPNGSISAAGSLCTSGFDLSGLK